MKTFPDEESSQKQVRILAEEKMFRITRIENKKMCYYRVRRSTEKQVRTFDSSIVLPEEKTICVITVCGELEGQKEHKNESLT